MKHIEMKWLVSLPWPQIWTAMSWEIALWVGSHDSSAGVKVVWNEDLLVKQVSAKNFFSETQVLRSALETKLTDQWNWIVTPLGNDHPHQLFFFNQLMQSEDLQ